jgi:hypothetical protein
LADVDIGEAFKVFCCDGRVVMLVCGRHITSLSIGSASS